MSFLIQNFTFNFFGANNDTVTGSPALHKYGSTTDHFATVSDSGYFDPIALVGTDNSLQPNQLRIGDLIYVNASDGYGFLRVNSNTSPVTVTVNAIAGGSLTMGSFSPGIAYSSRIVAQGKFVYMGGSSSILIPATGVVATDIVTASVESSTNSVAVYKQLPGTNTIAVLFSADPGASTVVGWYAIRVIS